MNFFFDVATIFFRKVTLFACFMVAVWFVSLNYGVTQAERPLPAGSPALVMQDCEKAPEGVFPTGVVLQEIGGKAGTKIVRNDKVVGKSLDKALNGKEVLSNYRVLAFCK